MKIVAIRFHIAIQCTKFDFGLGSAPDPANLSWILGVLLRTGEGKREKAKGRKKEREEKKGEGTKGKRKGRGSEVSPFLSIHFWLRRWLAVGDGGRR